MCVCVCLRNAGCQKDKNRLLATFRQTTHDLGMTQRGALGLPGTGHWRCLSKPCQVPEPPTLGHSNSDTAEISGSGRKAASSRKLTAIRYDRALSFAGTALGSQFAPVGAQY